MCRAASVFASNDIVRNSSACAVNARGRAARGQTAPSRATGMQTQVDSLRKSDLLVGAGFGLADCQLMLDFFLRADGFVGIVAGATFYTIVDTQLAGGADRFVVVCGHAERGAQFFVEFAQTRELLNQHRILFAFVGEQKFLVTSVP